MLYEIATVLAGDTFAVCVLAAVAAVVVLAFIFEASANMVISLLAIGALTAAGEAFMRARHHKGNRS